jgi:hypothetical protein
MISFLLHCLNVMSCFFTCGKMIFLVLHAFFMPVEKGVYAGWGPPWPLAYGHGPMGTRHI